MLSFALEGVLFCTPPPPCISYALVQATAGTGTALIWNLIYFSSKCSAATQDMGLVTNLPVTWCHGHICCECLPTGTHRALILGIFVHYIPLSCTRSPCNLLFLNLGVQIFSHVPLVSV